MNANLRTTIFAAGAAVALAVALSSCSVVDDLRDAVASASASAKTDSDGVKQSGLKTGVCIMWAETTRQKVPVEDCSNPHDAQVVGDYKSKASSPVGDEFEEEVTTKCLDKVESFIGEGWESLGVDPGYIAPDVGSWGGLHKTVTCVVVTDDGQPTLTQSLEGLG
ncbi:MAG: septum formation family protein [Micrococcales bacterium]|nr:septum formation family protein [Micrococcales bacterium]MCL2666184.1 septum formation family protein [Micrococcales bacterium]